MQIVVAVFIVVCVNHVTASITVILPDHLSNETQIRVWPLKYDGNTVQFAPVIGSLVEEFDNNKTDNIVILRDCKPPYEPKFREQQFRGVKAIICGTESHAGREMYTIDGSDTSDIHIPIVSAITNDLGVLMANNNTLIIEIQTEQNFVMEVFESGWMWVWQFSITGFIFANAVFATYRLYQLLAFHKGVHFTVGTVGISLCIMACLGMFFAWSIDPFGSRKIYYWWLSIALVTLPFSFVIAPMFLVVLWWNIILGSKFALNPGLQKYRWVFFVWISVMIVIEISTAIYRSIIRFGVIARALGPTMIMIALLALLLYCIYTLISMHKRLKTITIKSGVVKRNLKKIRIGLYSIIAVIVVIIIAYTTYMTGVTENPLNHLVFTWIVCATMNILVTIEIYSFAPPHGKEKPSVSGTSSKSGPIIVDFHQSQVGIKVGIKTPDKNKSQSTTLKDLKPIELGTTVLSDDKTSSDEDKSAYEL